MKLSVCSLCQLGKREPVVSLAIEEVISFSFFEDGGTFSFTRKDGTEETALESKPGARKLEVCQKCSDNLKGVVAAFQKTMRGVEMVAAKQDGDWTPPVKVETPKVVESATDDEDQDDDESDEDDEEDDSEESDDDEYEEMSPEDAKAYREYQRAKGIKIAPESDFEEGESDEDDEEDDDDDEEDDALSGLFEEEEEEEEEEPPAAPEVKPAGLKVSPNGKAKPAASGAPKRNGSGRIVHEYSTADLRTWARSNGYPNMKDRGAIPVDAKNRYEAFLANQK